MKYLQIIKLIIQLLPVIIEAIKLIEAAIPGKGNGEAKLAAVRAILEGSYTTATDAIGKFEDIWPAIQRTIGGIVTAYNASGVFQK